MRALNNLGYVVDLWRVLFYEPHLVLSTLMYLLNETYKTCSVLSAWTGTWHECSQLWRVLSTVHKCVGHILAVCCHDTSLDCHQYCTSSMTQWVSAVCAQWKHATWLDRAGIWHVIATAHLPCYLAAFMTIIVIKIGKYCDTTDRWW